MPGRWQAARGRKALARAYRPASIKEGKVEGQQPALVNLTMPAKTILVPGAQAAEVVARGDAELGVAQASEIVPVTGAQLVGPLPGELASTTVFSAGIDAAANLPKRPRRSLSFSPGRKRYLASRTRALSRDKMSVPGQDPSGSERAPARPEDRPPRSSPPLHRNHRPPLPPAPAAPQPSFEVENLGRGAQPDPSLVTISFI